MTDPTTPAPPETPAAAGTPAAPAAPAAAEPAPATEPAETGPRKFTWATGRRKTAVARVRVARGKGEIFVNDRPLVEYFPNEKDRILVLGPLQEAGVREKYDVFALADGGGITGQAGAVRLGIARVLKQTEPHQEKKLRDAGHLTRDARKKERKHFGRRGARRGFQFSKR